MESLDELIHQLTTQTNNMDEQFPQKYKEQHNNLRIKLQQLQTNTNTIHSHEPPTNKHNNPPKTRSK